jgi:hypothetical protein
LHERRKQRFLHAVERLRSADICVVSDVDAAAERYIAQRARWSPQVQNLAQSMLYSEEKIDPALSQAAGAVDELSSALRENGNAFALCRRKNHVRLNLKNPYLFTGDGNSCSLTYLSSIQI